MRTYSNRGYDIISNRFFVEENIMDIDDKEILKTIITTFETFEEYYDYLHGDIYEKSCYYQYQFTSSQIKKYKLDVNKFNYKALINYTIEDNDYKNELLKLDAEYRNTEFIKEKNKVWINKALSCKNLKEFMTVLDKFEKSKYYKYEYKNVLVYYLIKNDPKKAFKILMDSVNNYENIISKEQMCLYFSTKDVINSVNYNKNKKATLNRHLNSLKKFVNDIDSNKYLKSTKCKFDIKTNYFVIEESYEIENYFGRSKHNQHKKIFL